MVFKLSPEYQACLAECFLIVAELLAPLDRPFLARQQKAMFPLLMTESFLNRIFLEEELSKEGLAALGGLFYKNCGNQQFFGRVLITDDEGGGEGQRIPAVLALLRLVLFPRDDTLRLAALFCLHCYLKDNPDGQLALAATFKAHEEDSLEKLPAGGLMLACLLRAPRKDPNLVIMAAHAFALVLSNNDECKLIASKHLEEDNSLLMDAIVSRLMTEKRPWETCSFLIVLSLWLHRSPSMVSRFLEDGASLQLLIELIQQSGPYSPLISGLASFVYALVVQSIGDTSSFDKKALLDIARNRIGLELFHVNLSYLYQQCLKEVFPLTRCFAEFYIEEFSLVCETLFRESRSKDMACETEEVEAGGHAAVFAFEVESLRAQLFELRTNPTPPSLRNLETRMAYLQGENDRLQTLNRAFAEQLVRTEEEQKELLVMLASHDNEIKQLKLQLLPAEQASNFDIINPTDLDLILARNEQKGMRDEPALEGQRNSPGQIYSI